VRFTGYSFGSVRVDGVTYDHDLIIDRGKIRKRKKAASNRFRGAYGHTPLSIAEDILTYTGIVWPVPATGPAPSWDPCPWEDGSQAATVRCWHTVRRVLRLRRNSSPDLSAPPCTLRSWPVHSEASEILRAFWEQPRRAGERPKELQAASWV
jgi:hypothetical protein